MEVTDTSLFTSFVYEDFNMSSYDNLFRPQSLLAVNQLEVQIHGYATPLIVLFTIITNLLVCIVLLKKNMRSPTNTLLLAMAISDLLMGVFPVPFFIHFYTYGHYTEFIPYNICFIYNIFTDYLPTIFHTASIWLTLCLAAQRYLMVCHSISAKSYCTIMNTLKLIVVVYLLAIISHLCRFFEIEYESRLVMRIIDANQTIDACFTRMVDFVFKYQNIYYNIYYWYRVVFIHFIPCTALVVLNACLVFTMRRAQHRRRLLLKQHRNSESRRLKESNGTTLMLVLVVGVFLLVELPSGVLFIIHIISNTLQLDVFSNDTAAMATLFINFLIVLSYPINFFIYCAMSRQFRETFKRLFIPGASPLPVEQSQYMTLNMKEVNGKTDHTDVATHQSE